MQVFLDVGQMIGCQIRIGFRAAFSLYRMPKNLRTCFRVYTAQTQRDPIFAVEIGWR